MKMLYIFFTGFIGLATINAAAQTGSSNFTISNPTLVTGSGQYHGASNMMVELNWSTDKIATKSFFEVQRSFDGSNFSTIALVLDGYKENANTTACKMRDGLVTLRGKEKAYYRLKKVEENGNPSYSNVVWINLKETNAEMATAQKTQ